MKTELIALFLFIASCLSAGRAAYQQIRTRWAVQSSGVNARLRGVSAVDQRVAWASGSGSTVLRTTNGGASWNKVTVTDEQLDFRDIDAFDTRTAYILSIGNGPQSRIYKTVDEGRTWSLQFKNEDPKGFLDAMSFWSAEAGIVYGDSIDGRLFIMTTENGGRTWERVPPSALSAALENEGAFAASGTNIAVFGKDHAWIGTGGASKSRVLRTEDRGRTWKVSDTPLLAGSSAGIFSIAFRDEKHGVVVGGDYKKEEEATDNLAVTSDGGVTWKLVKGLSGFRSAVAFVPGKRTALVAVGPSGADYSTDDGASWTPFESQSFDTLSFARGKPAGWAAGIRGNLGMLRIE